MTGVEAEKLEVTPRPACKSCGVFCPEVMVPASNDAAIAMCWLCAHAVVDHGASPHPEDGEIMIMINTCRCEPAMVYPSHVLELRALRADETRANSELGGASPAPAASCAGRDKPRRSRRASPPR